MSSKARPLTPLSIDPEKVCILARLEVKAPEATGTPEKKQKKQAMDPVFPQLAGRSLAPSCQFHAIQYSTGMRDECGVHVTTINGSVHSCNLLTSSVIGHLARLARLGVDGSVTIFFPSKREGLEDHGAEAGVRWRALIQPDINEDRRGAGKRSVEFESISKLLVHAAKLAADMEALGATKYFAPSTQKAAP